MTAIPVRIDTSVFDERERLDDRLRCIDIAFESIKRAQRIYKRLHPDWQPIAMWEGPSPHGPRINALRQRIHYRALVREGLPVPLDLLEAVEAADVQLQREAR